MHSWFVENGRSVHDNRGLLPVFELRTKDSGRRQKMVPRRSPKAYYGVRWAGESTNGAEHVRPNRVDRIDLNILAALSSNARISKVQMSAEVGVSASRCYERMRKLEKEEIIRGYHADVDIARLASCLRFLVQIKLLNCTSARGKQFEKAVLKIPEIVLCQSVLGHIDYFMVVAAASVEKYQALIAELDAASESEFDFVTFPVSKAIKSHGQCDLRQIISKLTRDDSGQK
jgi:Lrp/AsnC family transcriptional regulator, regulator of ectoine-degradation genes